MKNFNINQFTKSINNSLVKLEGNQKKSKADNLQESIYKNILERVSFEIKKAKDKGVGVVNDIHFLDKFLKISENKQALNFLSSLGVTNFNFINVSLDSGKSRFYLKACDFITNFFETCRLSTPQSKNKGLLSVIDKTSKAINFTKNELERLMSANGYREGSLKAHCCMFTKLQYLNFYTFDKELGQFKATDKLKSFIKALEESKKVVK